MGDVRYLSNPEIDSELATNHAKVVELAREKQRRSTFTEAEKLADRLHKLLHYTVRCDYAYSHWPEPRGCRNEYLATAQRILEDVDLDLQACTLLDNVLEALEKQRFGSVQG